MATAQSGFGFSLYDLLVTVVPGTILLGSILVLFRIDVSSFANIQGSPLVVSLLLFLSIFVIGEIATLFSGTWDPGRQMFCEIHNTVIDNQDYESEPSDSSEESQNASAEVIEYPVLAGVAFVTFDRMREIAYKYGEKMGHLIITLPAALFIASLESVKEWRLGNPVLPAGKAVIFFCLVSSYLYWYLEHFYS